MGSELGYNVHALGATCMLLAHILSAAQTQMASRRRGPPSDYASWRSSLFTCMSVVLAHSGLMSYTSHEEKQKDF
jgi:hypothetical protein